jgi:hypothetical protein
MVANNTLHTEILGNRNLTSAEIELINAVRRLSTTVKDHIKTFQINSSVDPRLVAIANTHFEIAIMALERSVDKPHI